LTQNEHSIPVTTLATYRYDDLDVTGTSSRFTSSTTFGHASVIALDNSARSAIMVSPSSLDSAEQTLLVKPLVSSSFVLALAMAHGYKGHIRRFSTAAPSADSIVSQPFKRTSKAGLVRPLIKLALFVEPFDPQPTHLVKGGIRIDNLVAILKPDQVTMLAEARTLRVVRPTTNSPETSRDTTLREGAYSDNEFGFSIDIGPASSLKRGFVFDPRIMQLASVFGRASPVGGPSLSNVLQVNEFFESLATIVMLASGAAGTWSTVRRKQARAMSRLVK
jgi:hypothetical protein